MKSPKIRGKKQRVNFAKIIKDTFDYDVTGLESYVDEQSPEIMADLINASNLKSRVMIMDNIKGSKEIKLKTSSPSLQGAAACGWTPQGGVILTDQVISTVRVKIQEEYCNEDLNDTWAQIEQVAGANMQDTQAPSFADVMIAYYMDRAAELDENLMMNGDTESVDPNLSHYDGYLIKWFEDGTVNIVQSAATTIDATNGFDVLKAVHTGSPTIVKRHKDSIGAEIICGYETAQACIDQIYNDKDFSANIDFTEENGELSFILPTTNMRVRSYASLDGTDTVFQIAYSYMFYGTDLEGDIDGFQFKYDETEELLRFSVKWRSGIAHVFGQYFTRLRLTPAS